jgi:hypothetical protein
LRGHRPGLFKGQKADILNLLLENRGNWVPAYKLAALALQYSSRVKTIRDAGYRVENKTERVGGKVHGAFRLVACPGEEVRP